MAKLVLDDLTSLVSDGSAVTKLNNNFTAIEAAIENTYSRDGTSPNQMFADLDMNSYRIVDLVKAVNDTEPIRKKEFDEAVFGTPVFGDGGFDVVGSIAELKALDVAEASGVTYVLSYYADSGKGGGWFEYFPGSSVADDGGVYITPNAGGGRWIRKFESWLTTSDFGCKSDATVTYGSGAKQGFSGVDATESAFNGTDNRDFIANAVNTCGALQVPLEFVGHLRVNIWNAGDAIPCTQGWHYFFAQPGNAWIYYDCNGVVVDGIVYMFDTGASATFNRSQYERFWVEGITFKGRWQQYPNVAKDHRYRDVFRIEGYHSEKFTNCCFYDIRDKCIRAAYNANSEEYGCVMERCAHGGHRSIGAGSIVVDGSTQRNHGDDSEDKVIVNNADLIADMSLRVSNCLFEDTYAITVFGAQTIAITNCIWRRPKERALAAGSSTATKGDIADRSMVISNLVIEDPLKQPTVTSSVFNNVLTDSDGNDAPFKLAGSMRSAASTTIAASQGITGITNANPAVVTYVGADTFTNGDMIFLSGISGSGSTSMSKVLNNRAFLIAGVNAGANTFQLASTNTVSLDAYPGDASGTVARAVYPGQYNPVTAQFIELYELTGADSISATHTNDGLTLSNASSGDWIVSNIVMARTLDEVGAYSDWGYGDMYTSTGWVDPPVTDAKFLRNAIKCNPDMENVSISNVVIRGFRAGAAFYVDGTLSDIEQNAYGKVKFNNIQVTDCLWGFHKAGSNTAYWPWEITNCYFDLDPFHKSANRTAPLDGTWLSAGIASNFAAFDMQGWRGGVVQDCTFKNMYRVYANSETSNNTFRNNRLICKPIGTAIGYAATNIGIAVTETSSAMFHYDIWDGNPLNFRTTFEQLLNKCLLSSSTIPTTGTYVIGHFVEDSAPVIATGKIRRGWIRLTIGSGHILNTDWAEVWVTNS